MSVASFIARLVLAAVFMVAGAAKLRRRSQFERAVRAYEVGGDRTVAFVAWFVPAAEVTAGALLVFGFATRVAAAAIAFLLSVFIVASVRQLARGRDVDCGCFGATGMHRMSWRGVTRNLGLLALAVVVIDEPITALGVDQLMTHHRPPLVATDALAVVAVATLAVVGWTISRTALQLRGVLAQFEQSDAAR